MARLVSPFCFSFTTEAMVRTMLEQVSPSLRALRFWITSLKVRFCCKTSSDKTKENSLTFEDSPLHFHGFGIHLRSRSKP
jgi:hypothetical protein